MNPALLYLAVTLLKRRSLLLLDGLRRPLQLLAWVLGGTVLSVLYYYRNSDFAGQFVKNTPLAFFLSLLLIVSFVRALFQRGLVFDQADIEFLLAGPFSQRHLIFYRLIPSYLGAICTVAVFSTLFWNHFPHPMMTSLAIALFQLVCAHLSMAASILSGGLSDRVFSRLRFIACIIVFAYCVLWIQKGLHDAAPLDRPEKWNANAGRILTKLFFYPMAAPQAISPQSNFLPEISGVVETLINAPTSELSLGFSILLLIPLCCFTLKSASHLKTGLFEPVLKAHDRRSITRNKNRYGGPGLFRSTDLSAVLPNFKFFHGPQGALIWKNLICAWRSKGRLLYAFACTLVITASSLSIVLALRNMSDGDNLFELNFVVPSMIAFLAFLLQTALPFDLRLDAFHVSNLKTLPITRLRLTTGLIAVPTVLTMLFQGVSLLIVSFFTPFPGSILMAMVFGFPAIVLTIQLTWNINYLLTLAGGSSQLRVRKASAISVFVVLSALTALFYPAGYAQAELIKRNLRDLGLFSGVIIQYAVALGLLIVFARLIGKPDAKARVST